MNKPSLISGIKPSGRLHIGNYLGALKNFVELQNSGKYECFFFIADYHSLTEAHNPKEKPKQILDLMTDYLAVGLDPKKSTLLQQSAVPQVTELMWILNTLTPMGELGRMTQFKDKAASGSAGAENAGLFTYPVLMAADILLYDAKKVPVGDDQLQHLELARTLARRFNNRFGKVFTEPQPILTPTPRIMSLQNPLKKMSKTDPNGCIFLDDTPEKIREKLMRAVTDTGNEIKHHEKEKPGISNILEIVAGVTERGIPDLEREFKNSGYAEFKKKSAEMIADSLAPIRTRKFGLLKKQDTVRAAFAKGGKIALKQTSKKIKSVRAAIGLT